MRWMHRTPGRDACRRTKTLEGCQPFERVTSAFLLPSSYRIFLLASLPPESGRDRGREISAGSLPSSRDAELFRVVNGTLRRSSFLRRTSSLFAAAQLSRLENSRGFIASRENRCELRYRGGLFLPIARRANLAKLSSCESYQPPARLALAEFAFEETPQLSSPFSSKTIDRDKEPQTLPCRRCGNSSLSFHLGPNSPWSSPIFPALRGLKAPSGGSVASDGIAANKRPGWQFRVSQLSPLLPAASQFTIKMSLSHYLALALKAFDVTFHLPGTATASPKRCVD